MPLKSSSEPWPGQLSQSSLTRRSRWCLLPKQQAVITSMSRPQVGTSPAVSADLFTYRAPVRPVVSSIAPGSGSTVGGTAVTINGIGFTGATQVLFGTVPATSILVLSDTQITAASPAQGAGVHNIYVVAPGGTSAAISSDLFTYNATSSSARSAGTASSHSAVAHIAPTIVQSTYSYNGDGLRTSEVSGTTSASFSWDLAPSVPELLSNGSYFYIYGPNGLPVEQIDGSNSPSYFFVDANGSTRALLASDGTVGATFANSAYGKQTASTGTLTTALQYAGSYSDPASGLLYMINRYYNPAVGQFISVDPLQSETGQPYEYAGDDPLNGSDPAGLCWGPECLVTKHWRGIAQAAVVVGAVALVAGCGATIACGLIVAAAGAEAGVANYEIGSQSYSVSGALWSAAAGAVPGGFLWDVATDWYGNVGHAGETGYTAPSGSGSGSGSSNTSASSRSSARAPC